MQLRVRAGGVEIAQARDADGAAGAERQAAAGAIHQRRHAAARIGEQRGARAGRQVFPQRLVRPAVGRMNQQEFAVVGRERGWRIASAEIVLALPAGAAVVVTERCRVAVLADAVSEARRAVALRDEIQARQRHVGQQLAVGVARIDVVQHAVTAFPTMGGQQEMAVQIARHSGDIAPRVIVAVAQALAR